jgi:2-succinyl-6-hydroxy-2,4-cyclohexadiene-1-carboxylate synthase
VIIWALHGFLGLPSDFEELQSRCLELHPNLQWKNVDYLRLRELSPSQTLQEWGARFNQFVQQNSKPNETHVLLGYSQGGRLALHALKQQPSLWRACVLLSTNPGIGEGEKPQRLRNDQQWAERFLNENFAKTVEQWNAQSVFQGSRAEPVRVEKSYNRRQLADCLVQWSVAQQQNFMTYLSALNFPVLYLSGEKDRKYRQIGSSLAASNRQIEFSIIPDSGHRVLLDQPELVADRISEFLKQKLNFLN